MYNGHYTISVNSSDFRFRFKEFFVNHGQTTEKYSQRAVEDMIMNIISVLVQQHN